MYTLWMTKGGEKSRELVWNRYIGVVGVLHATGGLPHNISVYTCVFDVDPPKAIRKLPYE